MTAMMDLMYKVPSYVSVAIPVHRMLGRLKSGADVRKSKMIGGLKTDQR